MNNRIVPTLDNRSTASDHDPELVYLIDLPEGTPLDARFYSKGIELFDVEREGDRIGFEPPRSIYADLEVRDAYGVTVLWRYSPVRGETAL